ncbi:CBN-STR-46 protein [Caenorhabditis brenneri]|uniref:CBN-STR-46 protein n=1 Tax=Caenorhabditis brenneri TaxID=135651 RepID=G0MA24_CAEBE|nr:CBN-STR-46 protein [Caenorhabditis brenneri]
MVTGGLYSLSLFFFGRPDEYSDGYVRKEFLEIYRLDPNEVAHFNLVPYASDNSLRWNDLLFILTGCALIGLQYLIIIYCGFSMHFTMNEELSHFSMLNQKLQRQFFKALVVQTLIPTFLFVFPACPLLIGPLLDLQWSMQSGGVIALLGLYPPVDSIAFMLIVTEYRKVIRGLWDPRNQVGQQVTSLVI